jgi:signal transduction histidine kinase/DNA-binding NarL/FixJ family response regulator
MKKNILSSELKVLVCESDIRILQRLKFWIETIGNEVYYSDDGIDALEIYKQELPDILLVSQSLKSMSGLELIKKVKEIDSSQAIILMLDEDDCMFFKQSIELQVDKYLIKPLDASLLLNSVIDLTKKKLWHDEFRTQKKVLSEYKEAIDLSFSVTKHDKNGKIFYANKLFCKTTNLSYEEAISGIINPLDNQNINKQEVLKSLSEGNIYRDRQTFRFSDDKEHILDITAVAIIDDEYKVSEYLVFINDVSKIVYAARKLKEHERDKELQKLNYERDLNRVKDSFLTVFTHELKTPLNSIINFSEHVKKHLLKEDFKKRDVLVERITEISKSGWHMLDMISNLMEAIKLKKSNIELNITNFSANYILENIFKKNNKAFKNKNAKLVSKNDFSIYSDEIYFMKILDSLISNAIKYSKKNIIVILNEKDENFSIEILDDGDGFTDKVKVFNLFEQLDEDSMTRTATGTGIVLYIVKQLCDKMGYYITIHDSKELGGARVVVEGKKDIRK